LDVFIFVNLLALLALLMLFALHVPEQLSLVISQIISKTMITMKTKTTKYKELSCSILLCKNDLQIFQSLFLFKVLLLTSISNLTLVQKMEALSSIDNRQEIIQYMRTMFKPTDRIYINIMDNLAQCTDRFHINANSLQMNKNNLKYSPHPLQLAAIA